MNRTLPRRLALVAMLALAAVAIAAGCAKKLTSVDPANTRLEGTPSPQSILLVYPDYSPADTTWKDKNAKGVDPPGSAGEGKDIRDNSQSVGLRPVGTLHVLLLDNTKATKYELYRTAANGGLQRVGDFVLSAATKFLTTGWEIYETHAGIAPGYTPSYIARGVIAGSTGSFSPLSNETTPATPPLTPNMAYLDSLTPTDSLFRIKWKPVAGAAGYWVQVYQFLSRATPDEQRSSGQPSPIWNGNVSNNFVGYFNSAYFAGMPVPTYKMGQPCPLVLKYVAPLRGQVYRVRITAVDQSGRVVGSLLGRDFLDDYLDQGDSTYVRYPMASVTVNPVIASPLTPANYDHNFKSTN